MAALRFLFLDILTDDPEVRTENEAMFATYGGYAGLVHKCLGLENELETLEVGFCRLKDLDDLLVMSPNLWSGVVIGGSVKDIGPQHFIKHWQAQVFRFIARVHQLNVPILGLCGGYQYGARALSRNSDTVIQNPLGPNRGSSSVIFTPAGQGHPLFRGCSNSSLFQWSHAFVVMRLPERAVRLAVHAKSLNAAFQCGSFIGVQWHPEFGALEISDYGVKLMQVILAVYIKDAPTEREKDELRYTYYDLKPAPDSAKIFSNWVEMIGSGFFQRQ